MNPQQLWAFTNQGAVDFLTMQKMFPLLVSKVLELDREVKALKSVPARSPFPLMPNRPRTLSQ
jgi:hypothetical protein